MHAKVPHTAYPSHSESAIGKRRKSDSRQMSTRTSRKRSAVAAVTAKVEEAAETSEQDDVTDEEPDGADEAGSGSARRLMTMMAQCQVSQSSGASTRLIRRVRPDALHREAGLHRASA